MPDPLITREQIMAQLAATPPRLATLTDGLTPAQLGAATSADAWSVVDILAHLRACADVWGDAIAAMLAEDHPALRAIDPRAWMEQTDYVQLDFRSSLQSFTAQREALLAVLSALPPEGWTRAALAKGAGAPLSR